MKTYKLAPHPPQQKFETTSLGHQPNHQKDHIAELHNITRRAQNVRDATKFLKNFKVS